MTARKMPSTKAIAAAWAADAPWSPHIDDERAHEFCWRCAYDMHGKPTRAHIVAHRHGGTGEPRNFFLLCDKCHDAQPDAAPLELQLAWLKTGQHWINSFLQDEKFMGMMKRAQAVIEALEPEDQRSFTEHLVAVMKKQALETHGRAGARTAMVMAAHAECEKVEAWVPVQ
jgi:hypothetical protein